MEHETGMAPLIPVSGAQSFTWRVLLMIDKEAVGSQSPLYCDQFVPRLEIRYLLRVLGE